MKKDSEKIKKEETYSHSDLKRYMGSLSEQHSENLKAIKEGFQIVNKKLDEHSKKLDKHDKKLDSHSEMIGTLMENMEIVKEDVTSLKKDMGIVKDDLLVIKKDLKNKVDYDEFSSLTKRVSKLEAKAN